ncbi:CHAP domain-containing protein [Verrucomicrobia bacterium LW23]|nr:CHAP domain-containing protein [Verrucomicrobia bacterium LW23]
MARLPGEVCLSFFTQHMKPKTLSLTQRILLLLGLGTAGYLIWQAMQPAQPQKFSDRCVLLGAIAADHVDERPQPVIDSYRGVKVYDNGPDFVKSHGRHFSLTGYYYGQRWQCVEYIKRFYFDALGHAMPEVFGHARDFFDNETPQGEVNAKRDLLQYRNGGNVPPQADDLLVSQLIAGGYGHVAIITKVQGNVVDVVQQNCGADNTRVTLQLQKDADGNYHLEMYGQPVAGWLRKKQG